MNKSKFLKRSLAALLAILMVATMIPSAFAAVTTVEDAPMAFAADDPGYNISVDGNRATWDAAENAYTVSTSFKEGGTFPTSFGASMIEVKNHTVTVLSGVNKQLKATVADLGLDKAEKNVDSFGVGTYAYDVESVVTNDEGDVQSTAKFKLLVNLTMEPKSSDASLKSIKSARLKGMISAKFDNAKNTIEIVKALGVDDKIVAASAANYDTELSSAADLKAVFIPTNDDITNMEYSAKTLTVTAENGDKKVYNVTFTEESAFDTFKLGDFEGKAKEDDSKVIFIDLPYSYFDSTPTITVTELNKMLISWTTAAGNKVTIDDTLKESGKEKLTFAYDSTASSDTAYNGDGKYIVGKPSETVKVQTKKSGAAVEVSLYIRVPKKNPDAELTGIQILKGDNDVANAANYTQYVAINEGSRTINVTLPKGMSEKADDLYIHVWGAKNSKVELAEDREDGNWFYAGDENGATVADDGVSSASAIKVSKPITLKVVSEDEATTLLYNVTVKESTSSTATLSSLKVVDPDGKEVGTVKADGKNYTVTLPYKYGLSANSDALKALKVVATASSSSKIAYTEGEVSGGAAEAVAAVYESAEWSLPSAPATDNNNTTATKDITVSIGGHTFTKSYAITSTETSSGSGQYNHAWDSSVTVAAVLGDFVADYNLNATAKDDWTAGVSSAKVTFTAKVKGNLTTTGASAPTGNVVTAGKDAGEGASTFTPFVKEATIGALADSGDAGITLPLASKAVTEGGDNDQAQNIFTLRVDNGSNIYNVTIKKADPNKEAKITSAKVTNTSPWDSTITQYTTTISTRDAKDTSVIKVSELPFALDAVEDMYFSELVASDEAHVVIDVNGTLTEMTADTTAGSEAVSAGFKVGTGATRWDKKDNEVKVLVFSEETWNNATVNATITNATEANATKVYKMSATYAAAETGSELVSIASTLDKTVKVDKASKTVTITVPYSYVNDAEKTFSLDIVTSKLATVHENTSGGTAIVPDKGDKDTPSRTMFKVTKAAEADPVLQGTAGVSKITVVSESGKNTNDYNVVVKVAPVETSYEIQSITAAGKSAVKSEDGETWTLTIPADLEKLQLVDIVTVSKLAAVEVDGAPYDPETYYDLGDDLKIQVTAENGDAFTYTLKIEEDTNQSSDATLSEVKVGEYEVTKSGSDYTVKVPEGTDVTKLPLTLTATDSKIKGITVNGTAYTEGMEVDLTTAATIVVTAEDGSTATYTLTAVTGDVQKPSDKYTDIPAGAMGDYIKAAIDNGIMVGTSETKFSPNVDIPRWQFALLIARADLRIKNADITSAAEADAELKKLYSGTPAFSDPKNNELYDAAIEYCSKNKIISGIGNNKFDPNGKVNRLQAARMISDWTGVTDANKTENTHDIKDWNKINWGKHYVNSVYDAGFMQGRTNGNFGPQDVLKRSEAAVVIMKAYEYMADK